MTPPAASETNPLPSASETRFAVLFFTDIIGSSDLKARHGVPAYTAALRIHNDHFERIVRECRGIRILQNMGDGYFAEAGSVSESVRFALLFQDAMRAGPWGEVRLTTRVGIHAGEVAALEIQGGSGIVAPAADLAARVMSLAVGGQILLTRFPFDEARHFLREHPAVAGHDTPPLRWLAHGPYLLKGRDEPMDIFEVGAEGLAPLVPPPDGEKAKRAIRPGEEETLGWRPAIGLEIPGRPGWRLTGKLGAGGFGEVWIGEHAKLRQRRAFKFCFDNERLRALKREVTLVRLLRTALGDRDDIVRFHELKLDEPPFYLESDLAPHGNLLQWAEKQGGLAAIPLAQRIALVAHTATALAAAHSIGVLHKDIKPTNILIFDAPDGTVRPRLVDFGIGTLADPAVLGQHGVTAAGFTRATPMHSTGTPTYSPPEYLAGKPYTVQGDIYGLGVLLYQLITADSSRPIAPGWERDIADPLLREDIAACVDGDPARRLPSAADLAARLVYLDKRRAKIAEQERLARAAAARAESEAAAAAARIRAARLRKLAAGFAVLALLAISGVVGTSIGFLRAEKQRRRAETAQHLAQENFDQARAAVADLLAVSDEDLVEVPGMQPVRVKLMRRAIDRYKPFLDRPSADPAPRAELARLYVKYGFCSKAVGADYEKVCIPAYEAALAIQNQLVREHPTNRAFRADLGWTFIFSAWGIRDAKSTRDHTEASALFEALVREDPADPFARADLAFTLIEKSWNEAGAKKFALSERALAIREQLVKEFPLSAEFRRDLALSLQRHARDWSSVGNDGSAKLAMLSRATDLRAALVADMEHSLPGVQYPARPRDSEALLLRPSLIWGKRDLAYGCMAAAAEHAKLEQWPEAIALSKRAIDIYRKLVEQNPSLGKFSKELLDAEKLLAQFDHAEDKRKTTAPQRP